MTKFDCASKPSVREIVVEFSSGKWFQFSSGGSIKAAKHKLMFFRSWPWWMITKPNKDISNRKQTYLLYGNINCTCKVEVSDSVRFPNAKWGVDPGLYISHVICAWLSFQLSRIMLYCAGFESYIGQNFAFFTLLPRIVCRLADNKLIK